MARFIAAMSDRKKESPKILAIFEPFKFSSVNPFSRIHGLPNTAGEYHRPPIKKVDRAATMTAQMFNDSIAIEFLVIPHYFRTLLVTNRRFLPKRKRIRLKRPMESSIPRTNNYELN